jgi:hypothetical protein
MIDNHELEIRAMELFKKGEGKKASQLQEEFLKAVKSSGEDHCPCPGGCRYHGKCVECVIIHRGHGDHLPYCFRNMLNERIESLSGLTEHSCRIPPEK